MKVEKVPDSTYDTVGGLDKQIRDIKEVLAAHSPQKLRNEVSLCDSQVIELPIKHPELFESLGVAQPKVR